MKLVLKVLLFLFAASILMTLVFVFRVQPSMRIWEQYKVIYFLATYKNDEIRSAISDNSLLDYIVFEDPEYHHVWKNIIMPGSEPVTVRNYSLQSLRDFFFYDKSGDFKIIYVPDDIFTEVISKIKKSSLSFGTDSVAQYPYLYPAVCFAVLLLLTILGRISFTHSVCAVPLVLFCLWCPLYSSASGAVCILFAFYAAEQYSGRKYGINKALLNPVVLISLVLSFFSISVSGIKLSILYLISVLSCISLWISIKYIEKLSVSSCHFRYVPILTSKNIKPFRRVTIVAVSSLAVASVVLCFFFFISSGVIKSVGKDGLYLPSPSEYTDEGGLNTSTYSQIKELRVKEQGEELDSDTEIYPDITDFIDEYWFNTRLQYIRLADSNKYDEIKPGDTISIPAFTEDKEGIHYTQKVFETFDDDFLVKLQNDFNQNGGAEKFLSSQDKMFTTKYIKAGDTSHDITSILAIVSLFLLFVILLTLRLIKGCKK